MGARPIALMDPLRFGPPTDPHSRWIATGVISGISGYGNSVGVPTVGERSSSTTATPTTHLVNVLCCGVLPIDRLVLGRASGEGNLAVLLGSTTGRDGIGGVSVLASAGFSDDAGAEEAKATQRPGGRSFRGKAADRGLPQLLDESLVVGIQDLGGAGLTCATSETASRGGVGMDVDVTPCPGANRGWSRGR
jgi:phosphoribosylformylglycinamidine (FGAM) synthase-like enzyme